ncbi:MAG: hypothetical protein IPO35_11435 [Uliginosibacterium sp.]|nr:hypothetical protein [Uliginosibacterium sp.]
MRIQARDYWRLAAVAMLASGCGAAQAQVGLGAGVLGIGTVMLLGLALLGVAAWAALSGLLWLGARYAGRPWRFWQVARGVALAGVIGLIALGSVSFLRVAQGLWGSANPAQPVFGKSVDLATTHQVTTCPAGPAGQGCAEVMFLDTGGRPLAGMGYCVRDEADQEVARGKTDAKGVARYAGGTPGRAVKIGPC